MRKAAFCICESKGADQLHGYSVPLFQYRACSQLWLYRYSAVRAKTAPDTPKNRFSNDGGSNKTEREISFEVCYYSKGCLCYVFL